MSTPSSQASGTNLYYRLFRIPPAYNLHGCLQFQC
jgi:hypothetical protein